MTVSLPAPRGTGSVCSSAVLLAFYLDKNNVNATSKIRQDIHGSASLQAHYRTGAACLSAVPQGFYLDKTYLSAIRTRTAKALVELLPFWTHVGPGQLAHQLFHRVFT